VLYRNINPKSGDGQRWSATRHKLGVIPEHAKMLKDENDEKGRFAP